MVSNITYHSNHSTSYVTPIEKNGMSSLSSGHHRTIRSRGQLLHLSHIIFIQYFSEHHNNGIPLHIIWDILAYILRINVITKKRQTQLISNFFNRVHVYTPSGKTLSKMHIA